MDSLLVGGLAKLNRILLRGLQVQLCLAFQIRQLRAKPTQLLFLLLQRNQKAKSQKPQCECKGVRIKTQIQRGSGDWE